MKLSMNTRSRPFSNKPLVIFFMAFTLLICIICKEINKKTSIPYASQILFVGIVFSFFSSSTLIGKSVDAILRMGAEELFFIFIPILIFEQGFNSDLFLYTK